jgi:transcriptional regulator with PAS, ATPase and Fis domain
MSAASEATASPAAPWSAWVADSIQMGLIVLDEHGCVCLYNQWMIQSSGLSFEQVAGKNLFDIFPELSIAHEWAWPSKPALTVVCRRYSQTR